MHHFSAGFSLLLNSSHLTYDTLRSRLGFQWSRVEFQQSSKQILAIYLVAKSRIPNYLDVRDLITHKKRCLISNEREMTYPATCPSWFRCWGGTHSSELFSICIFSSTENQWWSRIQQCSLEKLVHSCLVLLYSGANLLVTSNRCCSKPIQLGEDCVLLCGWHKVPVPMWMCLFWFGITK